MEAARPMGALETRTTAPEQGRVYATVRGQSTFGPDAFRIPASIAVDNASRA